MSRPLTCKGYNNTLQSNSTIYATVYLLTVTQQKMAESKVEIYTTALRTSENNIHDVLKSFYGITYSEVKVTCLEDGHFKIQGPKCVIDKITSKEGPKKWTIIQCSNDDDTCSLAGQYNTDIDHYSISITYSHDDLEPIDFEKDIIDELKSVSFSYRYLCCNK